jgi:hypothetical protein
MRYQFLDPRNVRDSANVTRGRRATGPQCQRSILRHLMVFAAHARPPVVLHDRHIHIEAAPSNPGGFFFARKGALARQRAFFI